MGEQKQKKLGIALGGGGARGFAHIGIFKALEDAGIETHCISGTSMGSVIGAVHALAVPSDEMLKGALEFGNQKFFSLRNINFFNESVIKSSLIEKALDRLVGNHTFADCKIPFRAIAVDIESGESITLKDGGLKTALMASSAIPFVFPPVFHQGRVLVDGGLVNNVPVGALKEFEPDVTVGIDINNFASRQEIAGDIFKHYYAPKFGNFFEASTFVDRAYKKMSNNTHLMLDMILRSFDIATSAGTIYHLEKNKPDLLIKPTIDIGLLEFDKADQAIELGRQTMIKALPKLKELLELT